MLADILERIFYILQGSVINIPIDNIQGALYVVMNFILLVFATLTGTTT